MDDQAPVNCLRIPPDRVNPPVICGYDSAQKGVTMLSDPRRPTVVFVLGMFRSGTSALTRVLSLSGATLPPAMMGAGPGNPRGFWEPRRAVFLNDKILRAHDSSSLDPRIRSVEFDRRDAAAVLDYVAELPEAPVVVIKDLQITVLSELWFAAAAAAGINVAAVLCVRHPQEVIDSANKVSLRPQSMLSAALWLKYTLLAEQRTRHLPRAVVDYGNLLADWRRELRRVSAILPVDLDPDVAAVEDFLRPGERHQVCAAAECPAPFGMGWPGIVYEQLRCAARDEHYDAAMLDRVYRQYRCLVNGFGCVFDSFDKAEAIHRAIPRPLARLWVEAHALAHGRRGTWA